MLRWRFPRFHLAVRTPDVPVDDPDTLGEVGALWGPRPNLDALDKQPHQLRRQLIKVMNRFAFSMKDSTLAADAFSFSNRASFSGMASCSAFCSVL